MPLVRRPTAREAKAAGIISPHVAPPGNANLPIGGLRIANREIDVPRIQPTRSVPSVRRSPSVTLSRSTSIPSICSR
jgi:hypothetical protein